MGLWLHYWLYLQCTGFTVGLSRLTILLMKNSRKSQSILNIATMKKLCTRDTRWGERKGIKTLMRRYRRPRHICAGAFSWVDAEWRDVMVVMTLCCFSCKFRDVNMGSLAFQADSLRFPKLKWLCVKNLSGHFFMASEARKKYSYRLKKQKRGCAENGHILFSLLFIQVLGLLYFLILDMSDGIVWTPRWVDELTS